MNQDINPDMYVPSGENAELMRSNEMGSNIMPFQGRTKTECIDRETEIVDVELAHAYVPFQKFCPTFTPMTSLRKGTAFPGLIGVYGWERRQGMGGDFL